MNFLYAVAKYYSGEISINTAFNGSLNNANNAEGNKIRRQAKSEVRGYLNFHRSEI